MARKRKNPPPRAEPRLGIDIGRVIIAPVDESGADTRFIGGTEKEALDTPASPGAFDAIAALAAAFEGRVWIVSKCGPKVQERSRRWLAHRRFHELTGIPREHLRFCRQRRDKALHARQLRLTHFIDDRVDVLRHLEPIVTHRFLFGPQKREVPPWASAVLDWEATRTAVLATLSRPAETTGSPAARGR